MEIKNTKIAIQIRKNSSAGGTNYKLQLPANWIKELEISLDHRLVTMTFDRESKTITIKPFAPK